MNAPRIIDGGVDWFQVHARVEMTADVIAELWRAHDTAQRSRFGHVSLGTSRDALLQAGVECTKERGVIYMRNRTFRALVRIPSVAARAEGQEVPFNVNLTLDNAFLRGCPVHLIGPRTLALLSMFGNVAYAHVLRADLFVDLLNVPFRRGETSTALMVTRAKKRASFRAFDEENRPTEFVPDGTEFEDADRLTGWVVAPGNVAGHVRSYDKHAHLLKKLEEERTIEQFTMWMQRGWNPGDPVRRVELQCMGALLEELTEEQDDGTTRVGMRDLENFHLHVPKIWSYFTRQWLRITREEDAGMRASKRRTAEWWTLVQNADAPGIIEAFVLAQPRELTRTRNRDGASEEQTLGCVLSNLARHNRFPRDVATRIGRHLTRGTNVTDESARAVLNDTVHVLYAEAANLAVERIVERHGAYWGAWRVVDQTLAAKARAAESAPKIRRPPSPEVIAMKHALLLGFAADMREATNDVRPVRFVAPERPRYKPARKALDRREEWLRASGIR